jgi:hypothetical protein
MRILIVCGLGNLYPLPNTITLDLQYHFSCAHVSLSLCLCRFTLLVLVSVGNGQTRREYHIKWKGWAYIHTTKQVDEELRLYKGYKKVVLYEKGLEQEAAWREVLYRLLLPLTCSVDEL